MQTTDPVSVREYLTTSYHPDCDYVDGVVLERNVGERDQGELQRALIVYFHARRKEWGTEVLPEQRVQVSAIRFRVPDICKVRDYLQMDVRYVWILNPTTRDAYHCTFDALHKVKELRTEDPAIVVPIDALFED